MRHNSGAMRFTYCEGSKTIRAMPRNHIVASHLNGRWILDTDAAIPINIALRIFTEWHTNTSIKYTQPDVFIQKLTELFEFNLSDETYEKFIDKARDIALSGNTIDYLPDTLTIDDETISTRTLLDDKYLRGDHLIPF
ncbi:hypothetical protein [Aliivibrio fischeri]|uniref:hypothetical protein n=1 Tax=Aliivibrio fischeri TaxID=668 RepID=UPI0007C5CC0A|nr:hypothetical protein [Aliivibrio fischeri]